MGMGSDGSTGMGKGMDKGKAHEQVATAFAPALLSDVHASGGKAGPSARHRPQVLWAETYGDMDDPLSKGIPFIGLRMQTGENRQRLADAKILHATDESIVEGMRVGDDLEVGNGGCE